MKETKVNGRLLYIQHNQRNLKTKENSRRIQHNNNNSSGNNNLFLESTNPFQEAIFRGCLECIRVLVETPPFYSVNATCGPDGLRPIHIASRAGHLHVLRYLHSVGVDIQKCDNLGNTGLHHACLSGESRAVRWLLRHGANITLDKKGRTPIHVATEHGHRDIVTLLSNHSSCSCSSSVSFSGETLSTNSITPSDATTFLLPSSDKVTIGHDSSSSGNSSLVTTLPSSSSPSPSSTTSCSCSDDTIQYSTSSSTLITIGGANSKSNDHDTSSEFTSANSSFYLHPPPPPISQGNPRLEPFYLHPPPPVQSIYKSNTTVHFAENPELITECESFSFEDSIMSPVTPVVNSDYLTTTPSSDDNHSGSESSPPSPPPKTGRVQEIKKALDGPPPPPPLPPPMIPNSENTRTIISKQHQKTPTPPPTPGENGSENDYEAIDEVDHYEEATMKTTPRIKLNRSVSVPPPPPIGGIITPTLTETSQEKPKGVMAGMRRPFIPPNFPDPPKDALIKPSEYLKSIQANKKYGKIGSGNNNGGGVNGLSVVRPSSTRVEETIKMLSNGGGDMAPVLEETNAEDELEEVNPERINNTGEVSSCGGIRPEELMKVNLRKTPMSRTLSAPPLGRVLPDFPEEKRSPPAVPNKPQQPTTATTPSNRAAIIAELAESSSVGGVREWKEELRRRQIEEEIAAAKEIASIYSPLNFVAEIPDTDCSGTPIPPWKKQMLAKKAAERAKKEAEEQRRLEAEAKRASAIPPWKRQLMQRRDHGGDGKNAQ